MIPKIIFIIGLSYYIILYVYYLYILLYTKGCHIFFFVDIEYLPLILKYIYFFVLYRSNTI